MFVNIIPFESIAYNEPDTKYDYSYHFRANSDDLDFGLQGGNHNGGIIYVYSMIYDLFKIHTFQEVIIFQKIMTILLFLISFILIQKTLSNFIELFGLNKHKIASLKKQKYLFFFLSVFYFSIPIITIMFWKFKTYYLGVYTLFLLSFFFLLRYFKNDSKLDFFIYLFSMVLFSQSRSELFLFALFLLSLLLFKKMNFKEFFKEKSYLNFKFYSKNTLLIIAIYMTLLTTLLQIIYFFKTFPVIVSGSILNSIRFNFLNFKFFNYSFYTSFMFSIILVLILTSIYLTISSKNKFVLILYLHVFLFLIINFVFAAFDIFLNYFYVLIFLYLIILYPLFYLNNKQIKLLQFVLVVFILLSNAYVISSQNNFLYRSEQERMKFYYYGDYFNFDRLKNIELSKEYLSYYNFFVDKDYLIYKTIIDFYVDVFLFGTNNELKTRLEFKQDFLDLEKLKIIIKTRDIFLYTAFNSCDRTIFIDNLLCDGCDLNNSTLLDNLENITISKSLSFGDMTFCKIDVS